MASFNARGGETDFNSQPTSSQGYGYHRMGINKKRAQSVRLRKTLFGGVKSASDINFQDDQRLVRPAHEIELDVDEYLHNRKRVKMGLKIKSKRRANTDDNRISFVKSNITRVYCPQFKPDDHPYGIGHCKHCYGYEDEHDEQADIEVYTQKHGQPLSYNKQFSRLPTDGFGKIQFAEMTNNDTPAHFLRCADDTSMTNIMKILELWDMFQPQPKLIISVQGGAKHFKLIEERKQIFQNGVYEAGYTTNAWVVTGGCDFGVMKMVGDFIKSKQAKSWDGCHRVRCLGIAPWGYILGNNSLRSGDSVRSRSNSPSPKNSPLRGTGSPNMARSPSAPSEQSGNGNRALNAFNFNQTSSQLHRPRSMKLRRKWGEGQLGGVFKYKVPDEDPDDPKTTNGCILSPSHSHYLLIDNGQRHRFKFTGTVEFMQSFLLELSEQKKIPVIVILLEGGEEALLACNEAVLKGLPVVVCANTGRAANIITAARNFAEENVDDPTNLTEVQKAELLQQIAKEFPRKDPNGSINEKKSTQAAHNLLHKVMQIIERRYLLTLADLNDGQFDEAILQGLVRQLQGDQRRQDEVKRRDSVNIPEDVKTRAAEQLAHRKATPQSGSTNMSNTTSPRRSRMLSRHGIIPEKTIDLSERVLDQLDLALSWNRINFARVIIAKASLSEEGLDTLLHRALIMNDRYDFVKLFMENRKSQDLETFLTLDRLTQLYSDCLEEDSSLHRVLVNLSPKVSTMKQNVDLQAVSEMIRVLINSSYIIGVHIKDSLTSPRRGHPLLDGNVDMVIADEMTSDKFDEYLEQHGDAFVYRPTHHLFVWAVLFQKVDLADYFWIKCDDHTQEALFGAILCRNLEYYTSVGFQMQKKAYNETMLNSLLNLPVKVRMHGETAYQNLVTEPADLVKQKSRWITLFAFPNECFSVFPLCDGRKFSAKAKHLINQCYARNKDGACILVERANQDFGERCAMEMAVEADSKEFVATACCQRSLEFWWKQGVELADGQKSWLTRILCLIFWPLIFFFIHRFVKIIRFGEEGVPTSYGEKIIFFFRAPMTKFWINSLMYFLYLIIYIATMLTSMGAETSNGEYLLYFWTFSLFVEKVKEVVILRADSIRNKLFLWHQASYWNVIETIVYTYILVFALIRCFDEDRRQLLYSLPVLFEGEVTYRIVFALPLLFLILRLSRLLKASTIGPKIFMIERMMNELTRFIVIVMIFVLAFAFTRDCLNYEHQQTPNLASFIRPITFSFWNLFELDLTKGREEVGCEDNVTHTIHGDMCPTDTFLADIVLGIYTIIGQILLINLLIAIFSSIYAQVEQRSVEIYKFSFFFIVTQSVYTPIIPPPFAFIGQIRFLYQKLCPHSQRKFGYHIGDTNYLPQHIKQLRAWENEVLFELIGHTGGDGVGLDWNLLDKASSAGASELAGIAGLYKIDRSVDSLKDQLDEMHINVKDFGAQQTMFQKHWWELVDMASAPVALTPTPTLAQRSEPAPRDGQATQTESNSGWGSLLNQAAVLVKSKSMESSNGEEDVRISKEEHYHIIKELAVVKKKIKKFEKTIADLHEDVRQSIKPLLDSTSKEE